MERSLREVAQKPNQMLYYCTVTFVVFLPIFMVKYIHSKSSFSSSNKYSLVVHDVFGIDPGCSYQEHLENAICLDSRTTSVAEVDRDWISAVPDCCSLQQHNFRSQHKTIQLRKLKV